MHYTCFVMLKRNYSGNSIILIDFDEKSPSSVVILKLAIYIPALTLLP